MTTKRITLLTVVLAVLALLGAGQAAADEHGTRDYVGEAICVYNSDGRQECFWVNSVPGEVWHQYERSPGGSWSGAESLGGVATSGIDVAQNADGRLEIFVRAAGADLAHKWQLPTGGWSAWDTLGGAIAYGPEVTGPWAYTIDGRIYVDVIGTDNAWHTKYQTGANCCWSGWV
jgi:hypothetical protein